MPKKNNGYTVTIMSTGSYSDHFCRTVADVQHFITYLMREKGEGESLNLTISKNK